MTAEGHKAKAIYRDGWIWGLGANNMKSGLAAALVATEALAGAGTKLKGDLVYGAVVGEIEKGPVEEFQGHWLDGLGAGTRHMMMHGITADFAILCEPTDLRVCTVNMGAIWARLSVAGTLRSRRSFDRPGIVNAIEVMAELQKDLRIWVSDYEKSYSYSGEHPNVTVAAIRGGQPWRASSNAAECRLYLDIRLVPGARIENIRRSLRRMLMGFANRLGTAEPTLDFYVTNPATAIQRGRSHNPFHSVCPPRCYGKRRELVPRRAGSDARQSMNSHDVPCADYEPGGRTHPDVKSSMDRVW